MGMTMTQKILAAHAGLDKVVAGQLISAKLDIVLGNDITTPVAVNEFKKAGFNSVFDKDKVAIVLDHLFPIKILRLPSSQRPVVNLPALIVSVTFMMLAKWVSNTHCSPNKV